MTALLQTPIPAHAYCAFCVQVLWWNRDWWWLPCWLHVAPTGCFCVCYTQFRRSAGFADRPWPDTAALQYKAQHCGVSRRLLGGWGIQSGRSLCSSCCFEINAKRGCLAGCMWWAAGRMWLCYTQLGHAAGATDRPWPIKAALQH